MSPPKWIELTFVDVFGTSNALQLPGERWDAAVDDGVLFDGSSLEGPARLLERDMLLRPVPSTLVLLGGQRARAVCEVLTTDRERWPGDPRNALSLVVERLGDLAELWTAVPELEFYLLSPDGEPVDSGGYFDDVESPGSAITRAAADLLQSHGVGVTSCHHESGPGQFEIDLAALGPVALADALVFAKQAVRHAAHASGLRATFMPRPYGELPGNGLHLHQRAGEALVDAGGRLDDDGRAFVAGILEHAGALSALASPTVNSYKRLHSGAEAPGAVMWSHHHRAALVRVSPAGIEYRGSDPAANPYLLVAGLLLAGADGMERSLDPGPPQEESEGGFDPTGEAVRLRPLPRTLDDALDGLLADDVLIDGLGFGLVQRLADGRRAEAEAYRAHVTSWERRTYLERC